MIREAAAEDLSRLIPDTEAAVRIRALADAYGPGLPFLRLWCDGEGGFASLMDGTMTLSLPRGLNAEWAAFASMQPEAAGVRTDGETARRLAAAGGWRVETGAVMAPGPALAAPRRDPETLTPREAYPVLAACFAGSLPPFSAWYVDVSHRVRHGLCRLSGFKEGGAAVSTAMTVAECGPAPCEPVPYGGAALIGAVATLPAGRGKGYASAAVLTLARGLLAEGRRVFLSPKNARAHALYAGIGFADAGEWGSLKRR
ncbi:MAG TPA: GNAT family N-acetyltransferase [Firmicutes bacterium]|nr:GNAT family N-acetyltransferase [Bacillota bacterium]